MSIKTFAVMAAVAVGTFAFSDRAEAQFRRRAYVNSGYTTPYRGNVYSNGYTNGYTNGVYNNGVYHNGVYTNGVYNNGVYTNGVMQSGYSPYRSSYYSPYNNAFYNGGGYGGLYNGYNNIYSSTPGGLNIGSSGVIIGGVPIIR